MQFPFYDSTAPSFWTRLKWLNGEGNWRLRAIQTAPLFLVIIFSANHYSSRQIAPDFSARNF
jgi:hypothetical protein